VKERQLGGSTARRLESWTAGRLAEATKRVAFAFLLAATSVQLAAQDSASFRAFSKTTEQTLYPVRQLAPGVFGVLGDSGKGAEGRPNAGFIDSREGVIVVGGLASPAQARAVIRSIRTRTHRPFSYLVLYAHHPDMTFGAIEFKRAGARIVAHPDSRVLAAEGGLDQMVSDWDRVVGLQELLGFEFADAPDLPVTGSDTLRLGGRRAVVMHPGPAHSAGDLMVWLPAERVLFAGDILLEDGVTMVVDGNSGVLLRALELIDSLHPRVVVPGHGRIPADPTALTRATRAYITALRDSMRAEVKRGVPMGRAIGALPPPDAGRPVTLNSRRRRNAVRVYLEMEREVMGLDE
jgi:glyoxylase-like metal-dependent hydrolase (beta-lactamase superfamily II)